jgi:hypothetical protein
MVGGILPLSYPTRVLFGGAALGSPNCSLGAAVVHRGLHLVVVGAEKLQIAQGVVISGATVVDIRPRPRAPLPARQDPGAAVLVALLDLADESGPVGGEAGAPV